jgi:hypothetical protein
MKSTLTLVPAILLALAASLPAATTLSSPDGKVLVTIDIVNSCYQVGYDGKTVVGKSPLGLVRQDASFAKLTSRRAGSATVNDSFEMPHGKRKVCSDNYMQAVIHCVNAKNMKLDLIFRAYNDGVAFRYHFPDQNDDTYTIMDELTGFQLPTGGKMWLHPADKAGKYTPAYETYYENGIPVGSPSPNKEGWSFPVLFANTDESRWGLVTEAAVDGSYCGARFAQEAQESLYRIRFPDPGEGNGTGSANPSWTLPWTTPWRVIILGDNLAPIVESTLVDNLNPPSIVKDTSWIKPGRASWSWLYDHDSPQDRDKLKLWIDLAAEMGWEYSLIDANWTIMKNGTIHDLIKYADEKGVGLLLWYNSGGEHNIVTEKPRGAMSLPDVRRFEFDMLRKWGIKGVKIDFFQSDKQNIMQLYHGILKDAADYQLMVNFHGCTMPRGWERTYPHLMSMEAIRGEECYSFDSRYTEQAPVLNVIIPFTRNVVGPVDMTPVIFKDNVYPHITSYAHELAQCIAFESGWLHFADGPEPYQSLPDAPRSLLKTIPTAWDDVKFIAGYPGKYVVIARRKGDSWFVGALNGEKTERTVKVPLNFLKGRYQATVITDGDEPRTFKTWTQAVGAADTIDIRMQPCGGFTIQLDLPK